MDTFKAMVEDMFKGAATANTENGFLHRWIKKYIKQWSISFAMKKSHRILAFYLLLTNKKSIYIITNGN